MALLNHNIKIYKELRSALRQNNSVCFIHGTGLGKSFIFFEVVNKLKKGSKVLYVIPKWTIAEQIRAYKEFDALEIEVTFVTYHYFKMTQDLTKYDLVVFDEVHHIASAKYGRNALESKINGKILGLTATNVRDDKIDVAPFFDTTVIGLSTFDAIKQGLIPPFEYLVCSDDYEERASRYGKKRDFRKELTMGESLPLLSEVVADNPRNRWICFFRDITQLNANEAAVKKLFSSDYKLIKITTRHDGNIADVIAHDKTVILCVDKLLEGVHVPDTEGIILFRNVGSLTVFQQILGRVVHVGSKKPPVVLDCTSVAIKMLAKLLREDRGYGGNVPVRAGEKPILYCSVNNKERFNLTRLLALAQAQENSWTAEEIKILREKYGTMTNRKLWKLLPAHSISSIQAKASSLGLKSILAGNAWTAEEDKAIKDGISNKLSFREISENIPGRSISSVKNRAKKLGLKRDISWTEEELMILKKNYGNLTAKEIAEMLGRTVGMVKNMARKQGLTQEKTVMWNEDEIKLLRANYKIMDRNELSKLIDKTPFQITQKASRMKLKKGHASSFTPEMDKVIIRDYSAKGPAAIAKALRLSPQNVSSRASHLGVSYRKFQEPWTEDMLLFLEQNYKDMDRKDIAQKLGRTPIQVSQKAAKLGLKKRST